LISNSNSFFKPQSPSLAHITRPIILSNLVKSNIANPDLLMQILKYFVTLLYKLNINIKFDFTIIFIILSKVIKDQLFECISFIFNLLPINTSREEKIPKFWFIGGHLLASLNE